LAGAACGGDRYIVIGSARAPSACGFVEVDGTSDKSTRVSVHLEQLHQVDSLDPTLHAYVVWFENGKDAAVRGGTLKYRPEDRVGELKAAAPYRKFVVKVTAEANDTPSAPSAFVVAEEQISTLD
jgi:RNase P/RNase MRP subunit p29